MELHHLTSYIFVGLMITLVWYVFIGPFDKNEIYAVSIIAWPVFIIAFLVATLMALIQYLINKLNF